MPNPQRKLFFGLFVFPLLIAVGMALLLCTVVFLTHEAETPQTLISAIKTGSPSKRWQKAFELSNELNRSSDTIRSEGIMKEIIHILQDPVHYDPKTRGYMALALSHFRGKEAASHALHQVIKSDSNEDVQLYTLWALGVAENQAAVPDILPLLKSESDDIRKMASYVVGVIGNSEAIPELLPLLEDSVVDVRWNSALSLARLGSDAGGDVLMKMLERQTLQAYYHLPEQEIEKVIINATKGVALLQKRESLAVLETVSKQDKSLKVRQAAIEAIEHIKKKE